MIASLDVTKIPQDKLPQRVKDALADPKAALDRIKKTYDVALPNLKKLEDAGVTIAAGTDAGNIGTIHGPALFREFQLMKKPGSRPCRYCNAPRRTLRNFSAAKPVRVSANSKMVILPIL